RRDDAVPRGGHQFDLDAHVLRELGRDVDLEAHPITLLVANRPGQEAAEPDLELAAFLDRLEQVVLLRSRRLRNKHRGDCKDHRAAPVASGVHARLLEVRLSSPKPPAAINSRASTMSPSPVSAAARRLYDDALVCDMTFPFMDYGRTGLKYQM